jgi:hypothetical protein
MNLKSAGCSIAKTLRSISLSVNSRAFLILQVLAPVVSAVCSTTEMPGGGTAIQKIQDMLTRIGYPIAFVMMVYMGAKWIISEGPEDRENARRGVIYIVIALIMLRASAAFVRYLLC